MTAARRDVAADVRARLDDPRALCSSLGLLDGRRGRDFEHQAGGVTVRCPWHDERSPSCSVTRGHDGTVRVRCFGCGATGDGLALVAGVHRLDVRTEFPRVLEIAASLLGVNCDASAPAPPRRVRIVPPEPPTLDAVTFDRLAAHFDRLDAHSDVQAYAATRLPGADLGELRALPARRRDIEALRARIVSDVGADAWQHSGLARTGGEFAWFEHRLCIPYRDESGRVATVQRRVIRPAGESEPAYVFPRSHSPRLPYGFERVAMISPGAAVAYVEGALDVIALRTLAARDGLDWCVLGVPGVGNWRGSWANAARGRTAIVALDNDAAGDAKAEEMARDLRMAGAVSVRRSRPTGAKDWAAMLEGGVR